MFDTAAVITVKKTENLISGLEQNMAQPESTADGFECQ